MTTALGIDKGSPGGLAVVVMENGKLDLLTQEEFASKNLDLFRQVCFHCVDTYEVDIIATERPFVRGGAKVGLAQAEANGILRQIAQERKIPFCEYAPNTIRKAVTQNGRASKEDVRAMLERTLGVEFDSEHAADAAACAVVALLRSGK